MTTLATRSLPDLEGVIERGLATFVEVGQALLEIRERRLYKETHRTFESYCKERWNFNRSRASQIIGAAEVSRNLDSPPERASHAEALAPLKDDPEKLREAWDEANANGTPTAEKVREAVRERLPEEDADRSAIYGRDALYGVELVLGTVDKLGALWDEDPEFDRATPEQLSELLPKLTAAIDLLGEIRSYIEEKESK